MHSTSISWQHVILMLVLLAALYHFIAPLIPRSSAKHSAPSEKGAGRLYNIQFCKKQHRLWKWKRRFTVPEGDHAAILLTMIALGDKNFLQFDNLMKKQSGCPNCADKPRGVIELDRATRAYKSAADIAKRCTFCFKFMP